MTDYGKQLDDYEESAKAELDDRNDGNGTAFQLAGTVLEVVTIARSLNDRHDKICEELKRLTELQLSTGRHAGARIKEVRAERDALVAEREAWKTSQTEANRQRDAALARVKELDGEIETGASSFDAAIKLIDSLKKENAALKEKLELIKKVASENIRIQATYLKNWPADPKVERAKAQGAIEAFKVVLK